MENNDDYKKSDGSQPEKNNYFLHRYRTYVSTV